jgi:hypothetical protein
MHTHQQHRGEPTYQYRHTPEQQKFRVALLLNNGISVTCRSFSCSPNGLLLTPRAAAAAGAHRYDPFSHVPLGGGVTTVV